MKKFRAILLALLPVLSFGLAPSAYADGNVRCNAGPRENWKPMAELRKKA